MTEKKMDEVEDLANILQGFNFKENDMLKGKVFNVISLERCRTIAETLIKTQGYSRYPQQSKVMDADDIKTELIMKIGDHRHDGIKGDYVYMRDVGSIIRDFDILSALPAQQTDCQINKNCRKCGKKSILTVCNDCFKPEITVQHPDDLIVYLNKWSEDFFKKFNAVRQPEDEVKKGMAFTEKTIEQEVTELVHTTFGGAEYYNSFIPKLMEILAKHKELI